jgi:hypothetical protein
MAVKIAPQPAKPGKFVGKFITTDCLPVRHIHTQELYSLYTGGEKPCVQFFLAIVESAYNIQRGSLRENGYAIVCSLARDGDMIAYRFKVFSRESVVCDLGLL